MSGRIEVTVTCSREPSDTAWKRSGEVGARILENLAERDARALAARDATGQAVAS
ncbi:hypothetical protein MPMin1_gp07 [Microbacterium phage Min1]|uniref:Uncharacterized protein n=1 Tax=Microbacterium phage Min1 TaxID=446529 RepID=A6N1W5_9CAUD|nr:hypothetical protein MPMin1_gp07 [Microbacterium phage Min1]ABR10437.1 hypothetical protein [Microbacterium phage Min1]